jgi:3-phosphoglycerate kinase
MVIQLIITGNWFNLYNKHTKQMTTSQKLEKAFLTKCFALINEVQGKTKLPSQFNQKNKSAYNKQIKSQKQDQSALANV